MKKLFIAALLFYCWFFSAFAYAGNVSGKYYATDIKTYLNGAQIEAINIGGQTLRNAEERTLDIMEMTGVPTVFTPEMEMDFAPSGTFAGYYYETDIVTFLNGEKVAAYNTGGKTYIHAENLRNFGYEVNWYGKERRLEIRSPMALGHVYTLSLVNDTEKKQEGVGALNVLYENGVVSLQNDADFCNILIHADGRSYTFSLGFYQNGGLFYSAKMIELLKSLCHEGYGIEMPVASSEKCEDVLKAVTVRINGHTAKNISVTSGAGNGHRDFYITVHDLPMFSLDEIKTIALTVGEGSEAGDFNEGEMS